MAFSSTPASIAVEKATSDLLIGPDWTMNIDICDSINSGHWQAKDVVKAVRKRLHKSPDVQLLALTLLETMVKNCGDNVHFEIADRILDDIVKIVKKKAELKVRDKILVLLDSWQEAFGGPGGRYPQYYRAYDELRHFGVVFPKRSTDAAPIFTPPPKIPAELLHQRGYEITNQLIQPFQPGLGMSRNASRRLDETMATEMEGLSLSSLDAIRDVVELLYDMLQAVSPGDSAALKDEVIIELVTRCRNDQKKLIQMLTTTGDENLLCRGLQLNDDIQSLLAKHDALASGSPLPIEGTCSSVPPTEASSSASYPTEGKNSSPVDSSPRTTAAVSSEVRAPIDEDDEEDDEFAQLARRHSRPQPGTATETSQGFESVSTAIPSNALTIHDPPAPVGATKEQDMIDLLSMALSTTSLSPDSCHKPSFSSKDLHLVPFSSSAQGNVNTSQTYFGSQGHAQYDSYVAPWAQTQFSLPSQPQSQQSKLQQSEFQCQFPPRHETQIPQQQQSQPELRVQHQAQQLAQGHQFHAQPPASQGESQQLGPQSRFQGPHLPDQGHYQQFRRQGNLSSRLGVGAQDLLQGGVKSPDLHLQLQPQSKQDLQPQKLESETQYSLYPEAYPPPPWASTPEFSSNQNHLNAADPSVAPRSTAAVSHTSSEGARALQQRNSFPSGGMLDPATHVDPLVQPTYYGTPTNPAAQKQPFVPTYRLFEDLNVFGNADGKLKTTEGSSSSSLTGPMGPGMVTGRQ